MLKQEYDEDGINLDGALKLAVKVLSKTLDVQTLTSEKGTALSIAPAYLACSPQNIQTNCNNFLYRVLWGPMQ